MENTIRILMVEDELALLNPYKDYLLLKGYLVETATDGQTAIEKAQLFKPNIILLDIMLPKVDGLEVLKQLKLNPETKDIKVVLLTALGLDSVIKEGFDLGADAYLIKDQENQETVEKAVLNTLGQQ